MTYLDLSVKTFFENAGGIDFLALLCSVVIIWAIISALIKPFEV